MSTVKEFPFDINDYRLSPDQIDLTRCHARKGGDVDNRFYPNLWYEKQCRNKIYTPPGYPLQLCKKCLINSENLTRSQGRPCWYGMVTEDLLDFVHIPGSAWFYQLIAEGKLIFLPQIIKPVDKKPSTFFIISNNETYLVKKHVNVYIYDPERKETLWCIGRLLKDGSIDTDADEI
jgi:hypothetical protein